MSENNTTNDTSEGCFQNIAWLIFTLILASTVLAFWLFVGIPLMQCEGHCVVMIVTAAPK